MSAPVEKVHSVVSSGQVSSPSLRPVLISIPQDQGPGGAQNDFQLVSGRSNHTYCPALLSTAGVNLIPLHHSTQATLSQHSHIPLAWHH